MTAAAEACSISSRMVPISRRNNRGTAFVAPGSLPVFAECGEGAVGVGVHPQFAGDDLQDRAVLADDERDPLGGREGEPALDPEPLADRAVGVGEQRYAEGVLPGELLLLVDGVAADADGPRADGRELAARSRKWQASAVQPAVIAAG